MRTASADHWRSRAGCVCFRERHHLLLVFHARNEGLFISVCPVFKWSGSTAVVLVLPLSCFDYHASSLLGLLVTVLSIFASSLQSLGFAAGHLRQPCVFRPVAAPGRCHSSAMSTRCLCQRCCLVVARSPRHFLSAIFVQSLHCLSQSD